MIWYYFGFQYFALAGVTAIASIYPLTYPREGVCKAVGLILPLLGFLSWFLAGGGMTLGSVLAIVAGSTVYSWRPREVKA